MKHINRTSNSRTERRRLQARDRMRQLRERSREHRHDPLSYFHVPLPESVIHILVAELKIKQADDVPVDDRTWRSLVGLVIANVVKSAVGKKLGRVTPGWIFLVYDPKELIHPEDRVMHKVANIIAARIKRLILAGSSSDKSRAALYSFDMRETSAIKAICGGEGFAFLVDGGSRRDHAATRRRMDEANVNSTDEIDHLVRVLGSIVVVMERERMLTRSKYGICQILALKLARAFGVHSFFGSVRRISIHASAQRHHAKRSRKSDGQPI